MPKFKQYLQKLLSLFSVVSIILEIFISKSYNRKYKAYKTDSKWLLWSDFYKSWIIDTFFRSRVPKSMRNTTLLISAMMLLGNIPESCWRILQRLKVVSCKKTIEKWMRSHPKEVQSSDSILFFVLNNCNFRLNVTNVRSNHKSSYLNIINQCVVEVPNILDVYFCEYSLENGSLTAMMMLCSLLTTVGKILLPDL